MSALWDCVSCGATAQTKAFCDACGAAAPVEHGEDSALSMMLGLVCEACDAYNDPGVATCVSCGRALGAEDSSAAEAHVRQAVAPEVAPAVAEFAAVAVSVERAPVAAMKAPMDPPSWMTPPSGKPLATQFAMPKIDLAVIAKATPGLQSPIAPVAPKSPAVSAGTSPACLKCGLALTADDRFCRNCGTRAGDPGQPMATMQIAAAKMPGPDVLTHSGSSGTMTMPTVRVTHAPPSTTLMFGAATAERTAKLVLVRGHSQFGTQWRLQAQDTLIGRSEGAVLFPDDDTLAQRHCRLSFRGDALWLEPEPSTNGVFVRLREPVLLGVGDEVVTGAQRLRVLGEDDRPTANATAEPGTPTLASAVKGNDTISLMRVAQNPAWNEVFHRHQRLLTIGRSACDLNFPRDSFVSERHAQISREEHGLVLQDLRSRNGTYRRARVPQQLVHGDLLLLGDKVLRVELPR